MKKTVITAIAMVCAVSVFAQGTVSFNNRNGFTTHVYGTTGVTKIEGPSAADNYGSPPPNGLRAAVPYTGSSLIGTTGGAFAAATTYASLLGAPGTLASDSSMQLGALGTAFGGGTATTFRTGAAAGNIVASTATFNNIPLDAPTATFEMVAWDNSSGLYSTWTLASTAWQAGLIAAGKSGLFSYTVGIGGVVNTSPLWSDINPAQAGSFNIYTIPEPTTIALAGLGAAALVIFRRRKQ
jgi:hypothetical protein